MIAFKNKSHPLASSEAEGRIEKSFLNFSTRLRQGFAGQARYFPIILSSVEGSKRTGGSKNGFTLIEVLLAMAIIGLVLTPIFAIQLRVLYGNSRASGMLARIFMGKQFLVETAFNLTPEEQEKRVEKKVERPTITLIYELKKIPENSSLKKFKNVLHEQVTMQWLDRSGKKRQERLVTFIYKPEVKK